MEKKKSNKTIIAVIIGFVGMTILLVVISNMQSNQANRPSDLAGLDATEPSRLPLIGVQEMTDILNDTSDTGHFVYIGRTSCPVCQQFEPVFEAFLADAGYSMNYFEIDRLWADEQEAVLAIIDRLGGIEGVPSLAFVQNGEAVLLERFVSRDDDVTRANLNEFFEANGGLR